MKSKNKKTVFVGMSGGVDSSLSAALLQSQGFDVVGVFIKVWSPEWMPCVWPEERRDAMRVAAHLKIPLLTFDFEKEYKREVVDYMVREYKAGRTPNPDVMCNKEIKFGAFLKKAREMGADYVATGHYAQTKNGELFEAADKEKDQSYFLWTLTKEQLSRTLFPIGHMKKAEVRREAKKRGLPVAEKKDSQGLCFVGHVDMKEFLQNFMTSKKGKVLHDSGKVIGVHDGAIFYTLGQRHGFEVTGKTPNDAPYYVVSKDIKKNTITVAHEYTGKNDHGEKDVMLESVNGLGGVSDPKKSYKARIRYRQPLEACAVLNDSKNTKVVFKNLQRAVTPGQSLVLYDGARVLGGGVIR